MKRTLALTVLVMLLASLALPSVVMFADGTETLGDPSIPIAMGSGFVASGVGLGVQPGTITIDVPPGATVNQVLLYWGGAVVGAVPADNEISVNGTDIQGVLIGGPAYFFDWEGSWYFSNYRADITALGLVSVGSNTLTVANMDFNGENSGAGVLVIFDDGSATADIQLLDGLDLAYEYFDEPRQSTVPQTFTFPVSGVERTADLVIFAGGVGAGGTTTIKTTTNGFFGASTEFYNLLASVDGDLWDTLTIPVTIPALATSLEVQLISGDGGGNSASLNWIGAGLSLPPPEGEGCTPGAWQGGNLDYRWDTLPDGDWDPPDGNPFYRDTLFNDFFTPWGSLGGETMWDLVRKGGGPDPARKAARNLVAAYLNASYAGIEYPLTTTELNDLWDDAVNGNMAFLDLHLLLGELNSLGCEPD
jgi:hypothetical protein